MRINRALLVTLGVAVVIFILSRTPKGQEVVSTATDSIASGIIGLRLNNPLNIERGDSWEGLAPEQLNDRFATFVSMPYGVRAAAITLHNYQRKYGLRTVRGIINRWNPISDGQPESYVPNVSDYMGVDENATLNLEDRATMFALIRGMMKQEIGSVAALLVSDGDVNTGLDLAGFA